jgi:hypothetical protein
MHLSQLTTNFFTKSNPDNGAAGQLPTSNLKPLERLTTITLSNIEPEAVGTIDHNHTVQHRT